MSLPFADDLVDANPSTGSRPMAATADRRRPSLTGRTIGDHDRGMSWTVDLEESVLDDLRWFGRKDGRLPLREAEQHLTADPLAETKNLKTLRPNPVAQRELRLRGCYRVLFNADDGEKEVTIVLVGEKQGDVLLVRGEEFTAHHESDPSE